MPKHIVASGTDLSIMRSLHMGKNKSTVTQKLWHHSIIEAKTQNGWSVSVASYGVPFFFAVFRNELIARSFADSERRKFGLKLLHTASE